MNLVLPQRDNLVDTGEEDPLRWYYTPFIRRIFCWRLEMVLALTRQSGRRVLDVGYGSGILFKTLARRFKELHGLDTHDKAGEIMAGLKREGLDAELKTGSIYKMPYPDGHFDEVVAVSVFEHLAEVDQAVDEVARVLAPDGEAVLGVPSNHWLIALLFKLLERPDIGVQHITGPDKVVACFKKKFVIMDQTYFPVKYPPLLRLYTALRVKKLPL